MPTAAVASRPDTAPFEALMRKYNSLPNAHNEDLKALLVKVRPAFVTHLEHAKHLASTLGAK
jgi:predicted outer membrane protein